MKPILLFSAALALSAATAYTTTRLATRGAPAGTSASTTGPEVAALVARLDALERHNAALEEQARDAQRDSQRDAAVDIVQPAAVQRLSPSAIEDAVARWMEQNGPAMVAAETPVDASESARGKQLLTRLETGDLLTDELEELYYELRAAGLGDEAIAALEARAERFPDDAQAHLDLGIGYIHALDESGGGPERGRLALKADQAFDRALAIDDHNWTARFYKAVSLSHWPAFLGKQPEAIQEFEVLRSQQEQGAPHASHAQTYVYLGNLYLQSGDSEKAQATWQSGLDLYPENPALHDQLAAHQ